MIDWLLAILLILALPGWAIWKSRRPRKPPSAQRTLGYIKAIMLTVVLLAVCLLNWWRAGQPWRALGFDVPLSLRGEIGLALAVLLLVIAAIASRIASRKASYDSNAAPKPASDEDPLAPRTRQELWLLIIVVVLLGAGWEILYRGFLLWLLVPRVGSVAAICIAALAYGLAHGCKDWKGALISIGIAFAFTIAYALTYSLWWLMLIHVAIALGAVVIGFRSRDKAPAPVSA
ncbi:MAG TPA: CPBP family intramembrane glutamic endopeptidase [Rhodanobacteraceae bacterium]